MRLSGPERSAVEQIRAVMFAAQNMFDGLKREPRVLERLDIGYGPDSIQETTDRLRRLLQVGPDFIEALEGGLRLPNGETFRLTETPDSMRYGQVSTVPQSSHDHALHGGEESRVGEADQQENPGRPDELAGEEVQQGQKIAWVRSGMP